MEKFAIEKEKIGIIVGKKGATKKFLEKELGVKIKISSSGNVTIDGNTLEAYLAFTILDAICFGFPVRQAIQLKDPDYSFEIIELKNFAKSKQRTKEIKGRLIGKAGKVKETIQHLGGIFLHVSEVQNKIGVIGKIEDVLVAKEAIQALLRGAKHGRIFKWLEHKERYFRKQNR